MLDLHDPIETGSAGAETAGVRPPALLPGSDPVTGARPPANGNTAPRQAWRALLGTTGPAGGRRAPAAVRQAAADAPRPMGLFRELRALWPGERRDAGLGPDGDRGRDIYETLARRYRPLAQRIAELCHERHGADFDFDDLLQEAELALVQCMIRFDPGAGISFSTYAGPRVYSDVVRMIDRTRGPVRLPLGIAGELRRNDWPGDAAAAADSAGIPDGEDAVESAEHGAREGSAFAPDLLPDAKTPSPFEHAVAGELRQALETALDDLKPRERQIIRLRFGVADRAGYSVRDTARVLGVSAERVQVAQLRALRKLRHSPFARTLRSYLA